jgi:hypothetical protein
MVFDSAESRLRIVAKDDQIAAELERRWHLIDPLLANETWGEDEMAVARYLITAMRARLLVLNALQQDREQRENTR